MKEEAQPAIETAVKDERTGIRWMCSPEILERVFGALKIEKSPAVIINVIKSGTICGVLFNSVAIRSTTIETASEIEKPIPRNS